MKISYQWMQQFIQADLPFEDQLELLTDLGLEVEGNHLFESIKGSLSGVVVGEVIDCAPHSNADRLRVTQVDIGLEDNVQIVCGAPNVAAGQKVAVATVGTTLYGKQGNPWEIKKSKIRGELSHGMICAEDELGLGDSHEGIMVLDQALKPGTPCAKIFAIEKDQTIEIGLTPNRADAMSHMGVARDLKAGCIQRQIPYKWKLPNTNNFKVDNTSFPIDVMVEQPEKAPSYRGITLSNITVKPSPAWMQNRLKAIGIAPKNNVVDCTNYVMHELGQPLHAFDADKISGKIHVKTLPANTLFTTLDGVERKLHQEDLMICDDQQPHCIAGVFGGQHSGVSDATKRIFLECAFFDAVSIRKTAKRHGLNTDASFRYERGIDPEVGEFALKRAAQLIRELGEGEISSDMVHVSQPLKDQATLFLKFDQISRTIGQEIPKDELIAILNALEIEIINVTEEGFSMRIPRYRVDVTRPADVIEEILRIYGYNNVNSTNRMTTFYPTYNVKTPFQFEKNIAQFLVGQGFQEVINNSITTPSYTTHTEQLQAVNAVNLLNPLGQELSQLRVSLLFSMLEVVAFNQNRQQRNLKLYEMGKTYQSISDGYREEKHLAMVMCGRNEEERWNSTDDKVDFYRLKGQVVTLLSRLGISSYQIEETDLDIFQYGLRIGVKNQELVHFGEVDPTLCAKFSIDQPIFYAQFNAEVLYQKAHATPIKIKDIPKFPSSRRDFALLLDQSVCFDDLRKTAHKVERKILNQVDLFDVYEGKNLPEGKKSYGVSFQFSDPTKTLTDKYIDKVMQKMQHTFEKEFGASLR